MGPAARRRRGSRPGLPVTRTAGRSSRSCSCSTSKRILSRVRPRRAWRAIRLCLPFPPSRTLWRAWRPRARTRARRFLAAAMTRRSDSATRQPMVSSATRSWFRAAGRFRMISRMSSMASTKFLMYSMCRGMRSLAMFMLAADSGRPSICVRCPVSTMPTRNWPCRWSATGSPMSPRRRRVSVFAEPTISRPYESGLVTPDMRVSGCNHYGYHAGKRLVIGNAWGYV